MTEGTHYEKRKYYERSEEGQQGFYILLKEN